MTTTEHLQRIRARCVELLALAEKRTPGIWDVGKKGDNLLYAEDVEGGWYALAEIARRDGQYIAACAGAAESGWRATIAAIDGLLYAKALAYSTSAANAVIDRGLSNIIAAWPEELL